MARSFGRILSRIWDDRDFLALEPGPQRLYLFLCTQANLNHAGLLPLTLRKWSKKAESLAVADIERDLAVLDAARFVVVDEDSEELLIRTYVRNDDVWKMPRVMGSMVSGALEIESHRLRRALLLEMDRIPLDELSTAPTKTKTGDNGPSIRHQVWGHIETLRDAFKNLDPEPFTEPVEPSAEPLPEPPTEGVTEPPQEGVAEGDSQGSTYTRAHSPAPTPSPTPAPISPPAGGDSSPRQGAVLSIIQGGVVADGENDTPQTADQLIAYWIENVPKRPPGSIIGRVGKSIKTMLAEGVGPADIAAGLEVWAIRGKDPSVLPSIVNEVMNALPQAAASRKPPRPSTTDAAVAAGAAALAEVRRMRGTA